MAKAIDETIYEVLTSDKAAGSFYAKVGGRVSAVYGDPGDNFPLVVYEQTGSEITPLFGGKLMRKELYDVRVVGRWEDGAAALGEICDLIVGLFNGTTDSTVTDYDQTTFDVVSGTDIDRADELLTATVRIEARATQTSGL